jgi:N-formylglutamate amidohydrolase
MNEKLPIQYSAHHASDDFRDFSHRTNLTPEQRTRYSDYGTEFTVPTHGITPALKGTHSRGVIDLNRAPDAPTLFPEKDFAKPKPNAIWKPGQEPTPEERASVFGSVYQSFHNQFLSNLRSLEKEKKPVMVVAWDNTAHYNIGKNEAGEETMMQPFILSNKGDEGKGDSKIETTTCDPRFLEEFAIELRKSLKKFGLPDEVHLNLVYKGGYIPEHYNTRRHPELGVDALIGSFQVEYDTILTHDQETLAPDYDGMIKVRLAFQQAMHNAYINLLTQNI